MVGHHGSAGSGIDTTVSLTRHRRMARHRRRTQGSIERTDAGSGESRIADSRLSIVGNLLGVLGVACKS